MPATVRPEMTLPMGMIQPTMTPAGMIQAAARHMGMSVVSMERRLPGMAETVEKNYRGMERTAALLLQAISPAVLERELPDR